MWNLPGKDRKIISNINFELGSSERPSEVVYCNLFSLDKFSYRKQANVK